MKPPTSTFLLPKDILFWILSISSCLQAIAFYIPFLYLPGKTVHSFPPKILTNREPSAFATAIGASTIPAALLLSLLNVATIFGQIAFGWLSDRITVLLILPCSTIISGVFTATLWLLARNYAALMAYSVLYGAAAGGFSVLYARFVTAISTDPDRGLWLYGLLVFVRGISYLISGPISGAMLPSPAIKPGDYNIVIACTAGAFILAIIGGSGQIVRPIPRIRVGATVAAVQDIPDVIYRSREAS